MNKRLLALEPFINTNTLIDIGCDHGYLAIDVIKQKICDEVILCDINIEPLIAGYNNILKNGYLSQAKFILNDGLNFQITNKKATIVIAGMGGLEIIHIIKNLKQDFQTLILQPNSKIIAVRKFLQSNNLNIVFEDIIEDKKPYHFLVVNNKANDYEDREIYIGRYNHSQTFINYNKKRLAYLESINNKLAPELQQELIYLKKEVDNEIK